MKTLTILAALSAIAVTGCATQDTQLAKADCKIAPLTTTSITGGVGKSKPAASSLDERYAEMGLATSGYRMSNLRRNGPANNNVEDALRDCD
jgi:hypothetical protein